MIISLMLNEKLLDDTDTFQYGWDIATQYLSVYESDKNELDKECQRLYERYTNWQGGKHEFVRGALAVIRHIDTNQGELPDAF